MCAHVAAVSVGGTRCGGGGQLRQLQLYRHEMQHFVRALHEYVANEVVTVSWHEFDSDLGRHVASGVDDLRQRHLDYLHKCRFRWDCEGLIGTVKGKGSPYSIADRRVPELIPVLGSQPSGDVSHKPGGRLPLLSAMPAVTLATLKRAATDFSAW